jgi:hypothetical protein
MLYLEGQLYISNSRPQKIQALKKLDSHNGHSAVGCNSFPSPDNDEVPTELHEP